jgi:protein gp37
MDRTRARSLSRRWKSFWPRQGGTSSSGTSVEFALYKTRIDVLRQVEARIRFVSFEPLLGRIGKVSLRGISWAIVGGESGPNHRPIQPSWVRELRDQCVSQGVAFFFKQWGGPTPRSGGRRLDGRFWNEYPVFVPRFSGKPVTVLRKS